MRYENVSVCTILWDCTLKIVDSKNCTWKSNRVEAAAGDSRKTWKLYKEIVFNKHKDKQDHSITISGKTLTDSITSFNEINEHLCSAGERLATEIIAIHGYEVNDVDSLFPQHVHNDWSFRIEVQSNDVVRAIDSLPNKKSTDLDKVPISLLNN